ncbi:MAG: hypothetical protein ABIJ34_00075 [archaeon]
MVHAGEIINDCFNKTKDLFFPVRLKYWMKMGFVSLFSGNEGYGGSSGGNGGNRNSDFQNIDWKQALSQFNSEALGFLSKYGQIVGIVFFILYLISLFFTYVSSVFTFVFIDGIIKKDLSIKKSFSENKAHGSQLFLLRLVLGIVDMIIFVLIFFPLFSAFFSNSLADFNFWHLIPMVIGFVLYAILVGLFLFFVYDFVVPIMYLQKYPLRQAWDHFVIIARKQKMEIFLYWLIKTGLAIASGILILILVIVLLIPIIIIALLFVALGVLFYFLSKAFRFEYIGIALAILLFIIFLSFMVYALSVIFVPVPAFFKLYSIEMVKRLEKGAIKLKK